MRNTLTDLNNYLFETLERLTDDDMSEDDLQREIKRTEAVTAVAETIIHNGELALKAMKHVDEYGKDKAKAPYNWQKKHTLVWKVSNGEIPKGCKVVFLNNDTLDCRLENLYLATDAVHMMMIKYGWYSENPEITKAGLKCCELELLTKR